MVNPIKCLLLDVDNVIISEVTMVQSGARGWLSEFILMGIMFLIICFVVLLTQGTRKIPVQYVVIHLIRLLGNLLNVPVVILLLVKLVLESFSLPPLPVLNV